MRVRTYAKLNLFLRVLGRRPDGYHEIESVFHGIDLADELNVRPTQDAEIHVEMRFDQDVVGHVPPVEENIAYTAAAALRRHTGGREGAVISIVKRIPAGAGLGGGSANAAGVLRALNDAWGTGVSTDRRIELAASVGSDVPYCLSGGTALVTGRGEILTPLPATPTLHFILGMSSEPLSTRDVYERFDDVGVGAEVHSAPMTLALGGGSLREVGSLLHNDLETAAFSLRPALADGKERLIEAGALAAGMTGSGPTLFGIVEDEEHGRRVAASLDRSFERIVPARSHAICVEPVA